jgi:hypothetical protein
MSGMVRGGNAMTTMSLSEVMSAAQRLPLVAQVELVETLLRGLRTFLHSSHPDTIETELRPLDGMGEAELRVLADAVFAPSRQKELDDLLRKNREGKLTQDEEQRLDTLLAETDQIALLKARALYTLNLYQTAGATNR